MKRKIKGDLDHCPFCGIMLSWEVQNDIMFSNVLYFQCKNCKGELSINKNGAHENIFHKKNVFTVESVGGYNYSKLSVRENLTVEELQQKAILAQKEIEMAKKKKEEMLGGFFNQEGEIINTPKSFRRKQKFKRVFFAYLGLTIFALGVLLTYYILFLR